jgi:hypothetical protein
MTDIFDDDIQTRGSERVAPIPFVYHDTSGESEAPEKETNLSGTDSEIGTDKQLDEMGDGSEEQADGHYVVEAITDFEYDEVSINVTYLACLNH